MSWNRFRSDLGDISQRRLSKVARIGGGGEGVDLASEDAVSTESLQPQAETADPSEELSVEEGGGGRRPH